MVWSGAFPILFGLAAVAFAAQAMCKNQDKRTTEYQVSVATVFVGVLCAFCGVMMMGTGLGVSLFTGVGARQVGYSGYGGGYGGGWY